MNPVLVCHMSRRCKRITQERTCLTCNKLLRACLAGSFMLIQAQPAAVPYAFGNRVWFGKQLEAYMPSMH